MRNELKSRTAAAVVSLLMGCWATQASALCDPCTEPNGRGIYIADPQHYCIDEKVDGMPIRFCPEAFIKVSAQGDTPAHVKLTGTYFEGSPLKETKLPMVPPVSVRLQGGKLVPLVDIKTDESNSMLTLTYRTGQLGQA